MKPVRLPSSCGDENKRKCLSPFVRESTGKRNAPVLARYAAAAKKNKPGPFGLLNDFKETRTVHLKSWQWETRLKQIKVCRRVPETHTEEVCDTVMVPKVQQCQHTVTVSDTAPTISSETAWMKKSQQMTN